MTMANNSGGGGGFRIRHLLLHHLKKDPESRNPLIPPGPKAAAAKKGGGLASALRGLGCASASDAAPPHTESSSAAAAAAAVRSSADWQGRRSGRKKRRTRGPHRRHRYHNAHEAEVADVSDFWCAPGVVFGAEPPVDCVVVHRNRGERAHRERACNVRQGGINEVRLSSLLDSPSTITVDTPLFGSDALRSGHLRYARGLGHHPSPAEFEDIMMFQTRVLGGMDVYDQYKDLRLDVDNMSYEELLELSEKIGSVNTGLGEEEIFRNLRKTKQSFFNLSSVQKEWKCIICQEEEYEGNDDMGRLECGHTYHTSCIKQWLLQKNACPVCKTAMSRS